MSVKYFLILSIWGILLSQKHIISKIDLIDNLESGSISIIQQSYEYETYFNKTLFSVSYVSIPDKKKNYVSSNALIYLFSLIDTKFTRALSAPFVYSSYSYEKALFSKNEFRLNAKIAQETNYYVFYSKSAITTESYLGLNLLYKRLSLATFVNKPWANIYLENNDAFYSINLSIRFD